jgi:hypothetical protein
MAARVGGPGGSNRTACSAGGSLPPTNLKPDFAGQAQAFANKLADSLDGALAAAGGMSMSDQTTELG